MAKLPAKIEPGTVAEKIKAAAAAERQRKVFALTKQGHSAPQIAEALGVSLATVRQDITCIYDAEATHLQDYVKREIVIQLTRLDDLYYEARAEWERSKGERGETVNKTEEGKDAGKAMLGAGKTGGVVTTKSVKTSTGLGDPRYLSEARMLLQQRLKMLGLENPEKMQVEQIVRMTSESNINVSLIQQEVSPSHLGEVALLMKQLGIALPGLPAPAGDAIPVTPPEQKVLTGPAGFTEATDIGDDADMQAE